MKSTVYVDTYKSLRDAVVQHLISGDYMENEKRVALAGKFYEAESQCYNIEERKLYEYLSGCADPIKDGDYIAGNDYVDFLKDIIVTFNNVLPEKLSTPKVKYAHP